MDRKPRQPDQPILTRGLIIWLVTAGLITGAGTLGVLSWPSRSAPRRSPTPWASSRSLFSALFFSIATKDERRTAFSLDTFSDKTFNIATGVSVLTLILSTVLGPFQKFLSTTSLDLQQWLVCTAAALSVIVASEIRKAFQRRRAAAKTVQTAQPAPSLPSAAA